MVLETKVHGTLNYEEKDILTFEKGILGFEDLRKFVLIDLEGYEPFKLLHSLEDNELGLIVTSPYEFFGEYRVKLSEEILKDLYIKKESDVLIFTTVTLNSDPSKITTNLQGPLVINKNKQCGVQMVVDNGKYKVKQPLIKE